MIKILVRKVYVDEWLLLIKYIFRLLRYRLFTNSTKYSVYIYIISVYKYSSL